MNKLSLEVIELLEEQIRKERTEVDYDTREFTIEYIVDKYCEGIDDDENEFFVPDYQREFVWDETRQSKYIESIFLGLPTPLIFLCQNDNKDYRFEIVDGSQRIRTLAAFVNSELVLSGLEKITYLNDLTFSDVPKSRKRHFLNLPLRTIVLTDKSTEETRNEIFDRLNRGGELLKDMEKRKGFFKGPFNDFIYKECAQNEIFKSLTPLSRFFEKRQEHEELILRYFMLLYKYPNYQSFRGIARTLDDFMIEMNEELLKNIETKHNMKKEFEIMINFVKKHLSNGFAKKINSNQVSRVFFEAISVGVSLALREKNIEISNQKIESILQSNAFKRIISGKYHTHTPERIIERVNYVKDNLVKNHEG